MLTINVSIFGDEKRITGTLNGEKFGIKFSTDIYDGLLEVQKVLESIEDVDVFEKWTEEVKALLASVNEGDVITTACKDLMKDEKTGNYFVKVEDKVSKHPVPDKLVDKILESVDKDIDPTPIVKAWIRFLRNPNFSVEKARLFADYITAEIVDQEELSRLIEEEGYTYDTALTASIYNDVTITQEGLIVAKKYARLLTKGWQINPETNEAELVDLFPKTVTVDQWSGEVKEETHLPEYAEELTFEPPIMGRGGDAFYCGDVKDHIIKVGQVHELESWSQVNTTDNYFGAKGLHVGGYRYVENYKALNNQLLDCFVDPADIGAFVDGEDYAMRVLRYFIYGATKGRIKGIYHSSKYAKMRDEAWEEYKKEAIENANKIYTEATDFDIN
jgi:hypothetical protein